MRGRPLGVPTSISKARRYEAALQTAYDSPETVFEDLRDLGVGDRLAAVCAASIHRFLFGKPPEFV
jgi:hypothetical protein